MKKSQILLADDTTVEDQIKFESIPYDYDTKEFPIEVVIKKYSAQNNLSAELVIPEYQRAFIWDTVMQSRFIESLFLGVPVQPVFAAIQEDGILELIDGSQRIRTIHAFVTNKLKLKELQSLDSLNGYTFSKLNISRQRKFNLITVRFHIISDKAGLAIRADIFDRLNSNGRKLTASEIRKGAFSTNPFYNFVLECTNDIKFTGLYLSPKDRGEKEELLLRFFAYSESYQSFKHDVAIFLNNYVEEKGKIGFDKTKMFFEFNRMLDFVSAFIPAGFSKAIGGKAIPRVRFEAISVGTNLALREAPDLVPVYLDWLDSKEFKIYTTSDASNNKNKLTTRIEFVRDCLLNKIKKEDLTY
jgi:uncharacterized protein with ParB-like and HNH nuclease domain